VTVALEVVNLTVRFGRLLALEDVCLRVEAGTVVGLIGPNGAGKSTLIEVVAGFVRPSEGDVLLNGRSMRDLAPHDRARLGLRRTFQSLELFEDLTVEENVAIGAEATGRAMPSGPGLEGAEGDRAGSVLPSRLTHAQRVQTAIDRATVGSPQVVLLDEPAAGLDEPARIALASRVRRLAEQGVAVLLVDHDMALVLDVCDRLCVVDFGRVIADGEPTAVRSDPAVIAAYLGRRDETAVSPTPAEKENPATGNAVEPALTVQAVSVGYEAGPVVRDVDFTVEAGEVVALLGPNGAGKTTTLLAIAGILAPTAGSIRALGEGVHGRPHQVAGRGVALVPQGRGLFGGLTAGENLRLAGGRGGCSPSDLDRVLSWFPPIAGLLERPARLLSGGEQQMLALARALLGRPRLLLVDELSLGLAPKVVDEISRTLLGIAREEGMAVLVVEQHVRLALHVAARAVVMVRGEIVLGGTAADLAARPDLLASAYLGSV